MLLNGINGLERKKKVLQGSEMLGKPGTSSVVRYFTLANRGMTSQEVEKHVEILVNRVADIVGERAARVKVFGGIRAFQVEATQRFLEEMQGLPEIATTITSASGKDILISPVKSHPGVLP